MSNHEELVKALRHCVSDEKGVTKCAGCPYYPDITGCMDRLHTDAAAAIEALQAEVDTLKRTDSKRCQECLYLGQPVGEQLIPKRGKWIIDGAFTYNLRELNGKAYEPVYRCSCCNRQTESYVRLDEPKMPEDADFPEYCPHCGARMEVQDGK